ncbi:hypothetical protein H2200_003077 [Cladophialophora chaetospira]|uniref:Uncharacterized protein n=1 Tax=Cladophialophora chaetospira TaxID=386627 RepID=A0AA38XGW0_9EURO|nr:hypothetical protein H2200_003077 [Cladophialophora chaetospira]
MNQTQKGSYVGIELDEVDTESVNARASRRTRLSDISLLKYNARRRTGKVWSETHSGLRRVRSKDFWKQILPQSKVFFREAWADFKSLYPLYRLFTLLWPLLFIAGLAAVLPIITSHKLYQVSKACQPDSGFYVGFGEYDIWDLSGFFQITLGFGELSFSTAKLIDVCWDVIVGRGGQAILVAISFIVFSKALVRSMESSPVSYGTFEAVTLQHGSLTANLKLARDLLKSRSVRARAAVVWMIVSGAFVLAFPTVVSAMTGYSVNIESFVEVDNGNLIQYSNFTLVRYIVHDADRIDKSLGKDFQVTTAGNVKGSREISQIDDYDYSDLCVAQYYPAENSNGTADWSDTAGHPTCDFYWHVSEYGYRYGFLGDLQGPTTFNYSGQLVNLTKPSLNITAIFWKEDWIQSEASNGKDWWDYPFGYYWKNSNGVAPFHNFSDPTFTNGQFTYDLEQLNLRGRCQQSGTNYQWGFSFLVLFSFIIVSLVWCAGMYVMFVDAFLHSRIDRVGRSMGLQRAILDLAYCMHKDVDETGRDMLSNGELQDRIRRDLKGGSITYEMLDTNLLPLSRYAEWRLGRLNPSPPRPRVSIKEWLLARKGQKLGLALLICSLGFLAAALAGTHAPLLTPVALVLGSVTVLVMPRHHKSRWLFFLAFVVLAIILAPIGPYVYLDRSHYTVIWLRENPFAVIDWWYNE